MKPHRTYSIVYGQIAFSTYGTLEPREPGWHRPWAGETPAEPVDIGWAGETAPVATRSLRSRILRWGAVHYSFFIIVTLTFLVFSWKELRCYQAQNDSIGGSRRFRFAGEAGRL
jgi:hypothetical protein